MIPFDSGNRALDFGGEQLAAIALLLACLAVITILSHLVGR